MLCVAGPNPVREEYPCEPSPSGGPPALPERLPGAGLPVGYRPGLAMRSHMIAHAHTPIGVIYLLRSQTSLRIRGAPRR